MNVLITGWFSFEQMGASAGDLMASDLVCKWLNNAGIKYDLATAEPFTGGVDWQQVDPSCYQAIVFVCGPFGNGPPITEFLPRFKGIPLLGLNLTMLDSIEQWNPFDLLIERDSDRTSRPDLVFLGETQPVGVAGLILVHPQAEYGDRGMHSHAGQAFHRLVESKELAVIRIDTRLDENTTGLRTPGEVESIITRMDTVLTTRLHGMVLALKNNIPPVVIDPIAGGAKIWRQANTIGWPVIFKADELNDAMLDEALDFCLSEEGRQKAAETKIRVQSQLIDVPNQFVEGLKNLARSKV